MQSSRIRRFICPLLLAALSGCAHFGAEPSLEAPAMPASFPTQKNTAAPVAAAPVAAVNWRRYFSDPPLQNLLDAAVRNNADLQIALQRIETSRASVKLANGALLPQVGLNIGGGVRKFGLYTMDGAGNATTDITPGNTVPEHLPDIYVGLQSSWEIDVWGKLRNQRKAAVATYLASIEGTNFVIANLVAEVAVHYHELLALDHQLDIVRQTLEKQRQALDVVQLQKQAGRANELAVQQFEAQLLNTRILEKNTQQQRLETENRINFLLGRYPQPIARTKELFFQESPNSLSAGIPSQLLANRPDIREAELQVQASQFDVKAAKAAFFPNFNITAGFGFQAFNPEFLFQSPASIAYSVMGSVVAPLVNKIALNAQFNTAKANQLSAMHHYQQTILNAYVEVANQLSGIDNLAQIKALKKQQSELLNGAVDTSDALYKAGRATYLEVLIAQQSALQSTLELIDVTKRQKLAAVTIYKALGGGWS